jgi:hypothetical protein
MPITMPTAYPNQAIASIGRTSGHGRAARPAPNGDPGPPRSCRAIGGSVRRTSSADRPTRVELLALMAEANAELEGLLAQRANRPFHLL